jgi:hypothetical protein
LSLQFPISNGLQVLDIQELPSETTQSPLVNITNTTSKYAPRQEEEVIGGAGEGAGQALQGVAILLTTLFQAIEDIGKLAFTTPKPSQLEVSPPENKPNLMKQPDKVPITSAPIPDRPTPPWPTLISFNQKASQSVTKINTTTLPPRKNINIFNPKLPYENPEDVEYRL